MRSRAGWRGQVLEDQLEDAGNGEQANDKDNGDNPQNNFHLSLPRGFKGT